MLESDVSFSNGTRFLPLGGALEALEKCKKHEKMGTFCPKIAILTPEMPIVPPPTPRLPSGTHLDPSECFFALFCHFWHFLGDFGQFWVFLGDPPLRDPLPPLPPRRDPQSLGAKYTVPPLGGLTKRVSQENSGLSGGPPGPFGGPGPLFGGPGTLLNNVWGGWTLRLGVLSGPVRLGLTPPSGTPSPLRDP